MEAILCVSPYALNIKSCFGPVPHVEFIGCSPWGLIRHSIDSELKNNLEAFSPDVIFVPVERYFHFNKIPVINMVQNMEPLVGGNQGNPLFEMIQHWFRTYLAKQGIKKADRVIAISRFVKEYLLDRCNVPDEKIGLVYYGINNPENSNAFRSSILPVSWDKKFIFTAGSIRPTRGLEDIFLAIHYLIKESGEPPRLVIAGDANPNMAAYQNKLKRWTKKLGISDKVCWINYLNDNEMAWCYKNCKLFIMSSRVESFGQIALEAMSYGCISISADNPCLPEIFEDAAIYYPPKDSRFLAKSIKSVLSWNFKQKEEMTARARKRAAMFSWDVCAKKTVVELIKARRIKTER